jgi:hypothetical protein
MQRRLAAIMVADIVGYSSLMETPKSTPLTGQHTAFRSSRRRLLPSAEGSSTRQATLAWQSSAAPSMPCAARLRSGIRLPAARKMIR